MFRFSVSLLLAFATACRTPSFPIGIYHVPEEDLSIAHEAGFTHVYVSRATSNYLSYAHRLNLKVLTPPPRTNSVAQLSSLKEIDRLPALAGWYIFDEPDLHNVAPSDIGALNNFYKQAGAKKPTAIALMTSLKTGDFSESSDLILQDHYPVPWAPVARFEAEMKTARSSSARPVYGVAQAFDWKYYPGMIDETNEFRPPTLTELRCMTFMAAAADLDGLFYYCYKSSGWEIRNQPLWRDLTNVLAETKYWEPIFSGDHLDPDVEVKYRLHGCSTNESGWPSLSVSRIRTKRATTNLDRGEYLLCINTLPTSLPVQLVMPKQMLLLTIDGTKERLRSPVWKTFAPFGVEIFQIQRHR